MGSKKPDIRPLTRQAMLEFYDELPKESIRGFAVYIGDEPVAVTCVIHSTPLVAISQIKDSLREYPKTIMKTAKRMGEILSKYKSAVYAEADSEERNSREFLKRIGFQHVEDEVYVWRQQ